jgi:hypothetical protein
MNVTGRSTSSERRDQSQLTFILEVEIFQNSSTKTQRELGQPAQSEISALRRIKKLDSRCSGYPQGITVIMYG